MKTLIAILLLPLFGCAQKEYVYVKRTYYVGLSPSIERDIKNAKDDKQRAFRNALAKGHDSNTSPADLKEAWEDYSYYWGYLEGIEGRPAIYDSYREALSRGKEEAK